jgi:hypothetical protein
LKNDVSEGAELARTARSLDEFNPPRWRLAPQTYWRCEDGDIRITNRTALIRLNRASSAIFMFLLGLSKSTTRSEAEIRSLEGVLSGEALIERAGAAHHAVSAPVSHIGSGDEERGSVTEGI